MEDKENRPPKWRRIDLGALLAERETEEEAKRNEEQAKKQSKRMPWSEVVMLLGKVIRRTRKSTEKVAAAKETPTIKSPSVNAEDIALGLHGISRAPLVVLSREAVLSRWDWVREVGSIKAYQDQEQPIRLAVLAIGNIPWDMSTADARELLGDRVRLEDCHIPLDRSTGKTRQEMYVEMVHLPAVDNAIESFDRTIIKQRSLIMRRAEFDEVRQQHFHTDRSDWLSDEDMQSILTICRSYKHVISILRLIPWYTLNRAMIARMHVLVKGAIEALLTHLERPQTHALDPTLLPRLVKYAVHWVAWNDQERGEIMAMVGLACELADLNEVRIAAPSDNNSHLKHQRKSSLEQLLDGEMKSNSSDGRMAFDALMLGLSINK